MSKAATLQRIRNDVEEGQLGKAISRCQGLVQTYPEDLSLRETLGDLYYRAHYLEEAGRYWYLIPNKSAEQKRVCSIFAASLGHSPEQLLRRLHVRRFQNATGAYGESTNPIIQALADQIVSSNQSDYYLLEPTKPTAIVSPPQSNEYWTQFWIVFSLLFLGLMIIWMVLGMKVFFTEVVHLLSR
jgi:hypothetical protein